jgi:RNA polymerase sigma-70 factor, ECF subfamily
MRVEPTNRTGVVNDGILADAFLLRSHKAADQDEQLVLDAMHGSDIAFGMLFQRYERKMLVIAGRILRNREDAEDAVQQAFKHAFVHLNSFQGDSRFSTWITRIVINEALQLLRKRRPGHTSLEASTPDGTIKPLEIEDVAATPEERYTDKELREVLREAVGELRPIFRKVVQLYEIGELSSAKTARKLGLSNGTVKARAFRARRVLRQKLATRLGIRTRKAAEFIFGSSKRTHARVRQRSAAAA